MRASTGAERSVTAVPVRSSHTTCAATGSSAAALLFAGAASAVAAAALGLLLRRGEGAEGALVEWHLIAGLTVAAGALAALVLAPDDGVAVPRQRVTVFRTALFCRCAAVEASGCPDVAPVASNRNPRQRLRLVVMSTTPFAPREP